MADTKVSELTLLTTTPDNSDVLYIVDAGTSKQITYQNLVGNSVTDLNSRVIDISANLENVSTFTGNVSSLAGKTEFNTLSSNVLSLSGTVGNLNTDNNEVIDIKLPAIEGLLKSGVSNSIVIGSSTFTFLSGVLTSVT
jgi:hypothetical protein